MIAPAQKQTTCLVNDTFVALPSELEKVFACLYQPVRPFDGTLARVDGLNQTKSGFKRH